MSQNATVLKHIKSGKGLTSMEAFRMYGITRLAARIADLKEKGYPIKSVRVNSVNADGEPCHFSRYFLEGDDGVQD